MMPWWRVQEGRASKSCIWLWGALGGGCYPEEEEEAVLGVEKGSTRVERGSTRLWEGLGGHWQRGD